MNITFFENPHRDILPIGKSTQGRWKFPVGIYFRHKDLQIPAGILIFVMDYFLGHYKFKVKML